MTGTFKDYFSDASRSCREFRPDYPEELFRRLAGISPRRCAALDCGCGTGQASSGLALYFQKVSAVDPSASQITNALPDPKVTYLSVPAEKTGFDNESFDLIIAAQSLHWFDLESFYPEARRLASDRAVFAAISYGLLSVDAETDKVLGMLYRVVLGPYWPEERRHVDDGYRSLPFPFTGIPVPVFQMQAQWSLDHFLGYLATWSAVREMKSRTGSDALRMMDAELRQAWGVSGAIRTVSWPLHLRVGIVE
ncbi:MAG: class I SAM-dependent methyltransferase [Chlorobiaceae bacterium]|nr:class I SAM-dependent methyltransferase [Chlorobiaceae bacterium]NTV60276.1 class I SAM-dependent methyltransferase [Chlorobiaceae bacterium]